MIALDRVASDEGTPAFPESGVKAGTRCAVGMAALLLDISLELSECRGLFGNKLLDRGTLRCRRQRWVDQGNLALHMGDDLLLGCCQQRGELSIDGASPVSDVGAVVIAQEIALCHLHTADRARRGECDQFVGFAVFKGHLAQPFQGSRHWSRAHPLPRSRSFQ